VSLFEREINMPLLTTTIGAYPKPEYVPIPDWFQSGNTIAQDPTRAYDNCDRCQGEEAEALLDQATKEVIEAQVRAGIDIPTDGEVRRENYIHYHCRHIDGIDFAHLTEKSMRGGEWVGAVPTISGPIKPRNQFLLRDWQFAQSVTDKPVKITLPGPLTMIDSTADSYYLDDKRLAWDLAAALNSEIRLLADAGCHWIQVDEPIFAREPEKALAYGVEALERCFDGVAKTVTRVVHICCGYPDRLDSTDYHKAAPSAYFQLAPALDEARIDAVSLEDAHRHNDLSLLELFNRTIVILGVIGIARSRIESEQEIGSRLRDALNHIDEERLMVAPDCGLGMLTRDQVMAKLSNMVRAAKAVGSSSPRIGSRLG
jgi:5-methyltetrahydropteroyltriglutamate--homocysteine methyltransferase